MIKSGNYCKGILLKFDTVAGKGKGAEGIRQNAISGKKILNNAKILKFTQKKTSSQT